jgi:23S rRNA (adenine2503-C2)-methyltransferase
MIDKNFCSNNLQDLQEYLASIGERPYRAKQIFEWVYQKKAVSFDAMTNLGIDLRCRLAKAFCFPLIRPVKKQEEEETIKFLWELADGTKIESVLISSFDRRTVCVSTQVGCPARCAFCASGKKGLIRSLTAAEIVEQVLHIDRMLVEKGERVSHIVYMGMGEPMENYDAVVRSIRLLNDENTLNISQRRITVSTVGVPEGIRKLAGEELSVNLALSLHAPNQELRKKLIPFARKYPLEEILIAVDEFSHHSKRDLTFEYILIEGVNDREEHAHELASLLTGRQCTVNLIPLNPINGILLRRPAPSSIDAFRKILETHGINSTQRYTKGGKIAAACGQLAGEYTEND